MAQARLAVIPVVFTRHVYRVAEGYDVGLALALT